MSICNFISKNKILLSFFLLNIIFKFIPTINYIGYEFSVLNSIIIYWIIGILLYSQNNVVWKELIYSSVIVFIPLLISLSDLFFIDIEIFLDGLNYYLLIVPTAYLFSIAITLTLIKIKLKLIKYLAHLLVFILLFLVNAAEIYFNPQIYIYNILIGYFPGTIYDELILITPKLVIYRLSIAIFSIFITIGFIKIKRNYRFTIFLFYTSLIIYILLKPFWGLSSTLEETTKILNQSINTTHFNIHYAANLSKNEKNRIAILHEYYYERISKLLKIKLKKRVDSFIYANIEQKGTLFGSMAADVSKPWLYQIYLEHGSVDFNLQHELVHSFTGEFGVTPLKLAKDFNAALIEGFATAIDDSLSNNNIHYLADLALNYNNMFDINLLFSNTSFFSNYSNFSYIVAGSFIKYLMSKYGIERVIKFYRNNNSYKSFNKNIYQVTEDYKTYLNDCSFEYNMNKAKFYFGFKPSIKKQYPRYAAKINYEAKGLFKNRLYSEATKMYLKNYNMTGNSNSLINAVKSLFLEKKFSIADSLINSEILNNYASGNYYILLFKQIETKILLKDIIKAKFLITNLKLLDISNKINRDLFKFELLLDENIDLCRNYILSNYNDSTVVDKIKNTYAKLYFMDRELTKYQNQLLELDNDLLYMTLFSYSGNAFISGEYNLAKKLINKFKYLNKDDNNNCLIRNQIDKIEWFANKTNRKGKNKIE